MSDASFLALGSGGGREEVLTAAAGREPKDAENKLPLTEPSSEVRVDSGGGATELELLAQSRRRLAAAIPGAGKRGEVRDDEREARPPLALQLAAPGASERLGTEPGKEPGKELDAAQPLAEALPLARVHTLLRKTLEVSRGDGLSSIISSSQRSSVPGGRGKSSGAETAVSQ